MICRSAGRLNAKDGRKAKMGHRKASAVATPKHENCHSFTKRGMFGLLALKLDELDRIDGQCIG